MRLIDADIVKKLFTDRYEGFEYIEKDIDRIETAYDVDKVAEQLEKCKIAYPLGTWCGMAEEAIAIVKGAVKDE